MSLEMSEVFWTFFITSIIGLLLALGKLCYKSKCQEINVCCFKIVRNIEAEVKEDQLAIKSQDTRQDDIEIGNTSQKGDETPKKNTI
jgi:hypothetical protein